MHAPYLALHESHRPSNTTGPKCEIRRTDRLGAGVLEVVVMVIGLKLPAGEVKKLQPARFETSTDVLGGWFFDTLNGCMCLKNR